MCQEYFSGIPAKQCSEKIFPSSLETQTEWYLWENGIAAGLLVWVFLIPFTALLLMCEASSRQ